EDMLKERLFYSFMISCKRELFKSIQFSLQHILYIVRLSNLYQIHPEYPYILCTSLTMLSISASLPLASYGCFRSLPKTKATVCQNRAVNPPFNSFKIS